VETSTMPNVPQDLMAQAREAKNAFDRGEYRDAEKSYEKMLLHAPNNVYILSNLGVVEFRQNKMKLAEEKFKKAIAVAPDDSFSHRTLGIVYYQQSKYDEAIQSLTKAIAITPKDPISHNYLGIGASAKGWQEAALKELETAIALDPNYADANFNLAVIYATMQPPNKELARKYYKRAVELGAEPDSALEQLVK
jgi:tetratricopeptide (TPR) repeat protein